jgi:outer membrane protein assembly factor BamD (BamD/ComL family)
MNLPYTKAVFKAAFALAFVAFIVSCASGPVVIPDDMPPAKIIQKAQEASDRNKYNLSLQYYRTLLARYGDTDEYLCTAEYEIAFIYYKQKRYTDARAGLEQLLARYDTVDAALLPPHFKILAEKVLSKIIEKGF